VEPTQEQQYQQRIAELEGQLAERDRRIATLETQFAELQARFAALSEQNAKLLEQVAKLSKNSSNSSKPPSSDIVKPPRPASPSGPRKTGGQFGHPGAHHQPFSESQLNDHWEQVPAHCPRGHDLAGQPAQAPKILQQVELAPDPVVRTEYRRPGVLCPICDEMVYADLPAGVIDGQLFGPRLLALLGYMKGSLHTTYSGLESFCRDVLGLEVSRGHLGNALVRVSTALAPAYAELAARIPTEPVLNIDESGWKDRGSNYWIWIFATSAMSFFVIARSRSSQVLRTVLGETYRGTIVSDFFSAYVKYANLLQQFCLAHLIRENKFIAELPDPFERAFGRTLLLQFKRLFHFWHLRETIPKDRFDRLMQKIQNRIFALAERENLPKHSARLAKRLRKHDCALFRFLFDPAVSPTNNLAEQSIRHSVLNRRLTQGSRSLWGRQWNERIFTVIGTCRKQGRSAWQFLQETVSAHYFHTQRPSLIPQTH